MLAVVVDRPGNVEIGSADDPSLGLVAPNGSSLSRHGALLRVLAAGVCGSDLHVIDDPATVAGTIVGHELVGEVLELGRDVRGIRVGDVCVAPFNVSCGACESCLRGLTCHCIEACPPRTGATYGMGMGWEGLQAELAVIPWAEHNLIVIPGRDLTDRNIAELVLATDVLPTGFHAVKRAGVDPGSSVYIAGAGPVGLAAAVAAQRRGAQVVIGETNPTRRELAAEAGFRTIDPMAAELTEQFREELGTAFVDVAIDCVGVNVSATERLATAGQLLDSLLGAVRLGGAIAIPGVYPARLQAVQVRLGVIWSRSLRIVAGPTPARQYLSDIAKMLLAEELDVSSALTPQRVLLSQASAAYQQFRAGSVAKIALMPALD